MRGPEIATLCKAAGRQLANDGETIAAEILFLAAVVLDELADTIWSEQLDRDYWRARAA